MCFGLKFLFYNKHSYNIHTIKYKWIWLEVETVCTLVDVCAAAYRSVCGCMLKESNVIERIKPESKIKLTMTSINQPVV